MRERFKIRRIYFSVKWLLAHDTVTLTRSATANRSIDVAATLHYLRVAGGPARRLGREGSGFQAANVGHRWREHSHFPPRASTKFTIMERRRRITELTKPSKY